MITKTVRMAILERVLLEMGYVKHVIPNPQHVLPDQQPVTPTLRKFFPYALMFEHPQENGAKLLMPLFKENDQVPLLNLRLAQITVDDWGIADRETFERMLAESVEQDTLTEPETVAAGA